MVPGFYFIVGEPMTVEDKKEEIVYTNDIVAMMSPEGEKISLGRVGFIRYSILKI